MRLVIWAGHGPKEPGHDDPGVCSPRAEECEADWTTDLAALLAAELRRLGHDVDDLVLGPYAQRAELTDAAGAELVVHLHGDTGTPAIYAYPGSARGEAAAGAILLGRRRAGEALGAGAAGGGWRVAPAARRGALGTVEAVHAAFLSASPLVRRALCQPWS